MSLVVMKFGGTSVATPENRQRVIRHVGRELKNGRNVVVVVSAMGRKGAPYATDTLLSLLKGRDALTKDLLASCGETISACVLADELREAGIRAIPFTAESAGIRTDSSFGSAEILGMETGAVRSALARGLVPVITGFQGRTAEGLVTTLGRGGSDTSAVAVAGYLKADAADIYTDVPGIAKADPRLVPEPAFMDSVSARDMLILAQWGSGVIHPRAIRTAMDLHVPVLRVRSTFGEGCGTVIGGETKDPFSGIAVLRGPQKLSEMGIPDGAELSEGEAVITLVYHGLPGEIRALLAEKEVIADGSVFRVRVGEEEVLRTVRALYEACRKG